MRKLIGYFVYVSVSLIEGTLLYLLVRLIFQSQGTPLPPIGSSTFSWFMVLWPFLALVVRPGLRIIPIIGEIFSATEELAKSGFAQQAQYVDVEAYKAEASGVGTVPSSRASWVRCRICKNRVDMSEYSSHMEDHTKGLKASEVGVVTRETGNELTVTCPSCKCLILESKYDLHM